MGPGRETETRLWIRCERQGLGHGPDGWDRYVQCQEPVEADKDQVGDQDRDQMFGKIRRRTWTMCKRHGPGERDRDKDMSQMEEKVNKDMGQVERQGPMQGQVGEIGTRTWSRRDTGTRTLAWWGELLLGDRTGTQKSEGWEGGERK
jgi:hypothetical protein